MAKHVERPIILPLSNPTRLHEAIPEDLLNWTEGRALVATGSPFPPVKYNGQWYEVGKRPAPSRKGKILLSFKYGATDIRLSIIKAECNNSTAFPGIGLGVILSRSRLLSDKMLVAAVKAIAQQSPVLKDPKKGLVPDITDVREVSVHIAKAVIQQAVNEGLATEKDIPKDDDELEEWVKVQMWEPRYRPLVKG